VFPPCQTDGAARIVDVSRFRVVRAFSLEGVGMSAWFESLERMNMRASAAAVRRTLGVASMVLMSSALLYAQPVPGVDTGKKVGNIIKSAIDVALPGVSAIMDAIWPDRKKDSVKKDDLKKAVTDARDKFYADAQKKVAGIDIIGKELETVSLFLEAAVGASRRVVAMRTRLEASPVQWAELETDWKVVKNRLEGLKKIDDPKLLTIRETSLQTDFKKIRNLHLDLLEDINAAVTQKNVDRLKALLSDLAKTLDGVDALVGLEILTLSSEVEEASKWAKGAAGSGTAEQPAAKLFREVLKTGLTRETTR